MITAPPILVSSSEIVFEQKSGGKLPLKHFAKGRIAEAKVLQVLSGRRALLMIGGQKVTAKTFLPLQTGQTILLKLEQGGERPVFKFAGLPGETAGTNQTIPVGFLGKARPYVMLTRLLEGLAPSSLTGSDGLTERFAALKALVSHLSLNSEVPTQVFLKRIMDGCGLLWESKLAALVSKGSAFSPEAVDRLVAGDLKAVVHQLLSGAGERLPETMAGSLKGVLEGLEQHQLLNRHLLENDGRYLLPIPLADHQALKFGQLLLGFGDPKEDGDGKDRVVTVSFLLSLSQLGEFRADFSVLKTGLTGAFGVADQSVRALVVRHLPELREKLQHHGYNVLDISCRVLASEHLSEVNFVAQALAPPSEGFFNLVV